MSKFLQMLFIWCVHVYISEQKQAAGRRICCGGPSHPPLSASTFCCFLTPLSPIIILYVLLLVMLPLHYKMTFSVKLHSSQTPERMHIT